MTDKFEAILDESISALQAGVPIEDIMAEVPEYAAELQPMLYAAMLLADPKPELLPETQKETLRNQYLAQVADLPPPPSLPGGKNKCHHARDAQKVNSRGTVIRPVYDSHNCNFDIGDGYRCSKLRSPGQPARRCFAWDKASNRTDQTGANRRHYSEREAATAV
jgi:hypothetical protein